MNDVIKTIKERSSIRAYNTGGYSAYSDVVDYTTTAATPPAAPTTHPRTRRTPGPLEAPAPVIAPLPVIARLRRKQTCARIRCSRYDRRTGRYEWESR